MNQPVPDPSRTAACGVPLGRVISTWAVADLLEWTRRTKPDKAAGL